MLFLCIWRVEECLGRNFNASVDYDHECTVVCWATRCGGDERSGMKKAAPLWHEFRQTLVYVIVCYLKKDAKQSWV